MCCGWGGRCPPQRKLIECDNVNMESSTEVRQARNGKKKVNKVKVKKNVNHTQFYFPPTGKFPCLRKLACIRLRKKWVDEQKKGEVV